MSNPDPIAAALSLLFLAFPSGVTADVKTLYLGELRRLSIDPRDALEAAQRVLHTHESSRVPTFAVILKHCRESRVDRLRAEQSEEDAQQLNDGSRRLNPSDAQHLRNWRVVVDRGIHWCGNLGTWGREHCPCFPACHDRNTPSMDSVAAKAAEVRHLPKVQRAKPPRGFSNAGDVAMGGLG